MQVLINSSYSIKIWKKIKNQLNNVLPNIRQNRTTLLTYGPYVLWVNKICYKATLLTHNIPKLWCLKLIIR